MLGIEDVGKEFFNKIFKILAKKNPKLARIIIWLLITGSLASFLQIIFNPLGYKNVSVLIVYFGLVVIVGAISYIFVSEIELHKEIMETKVFAPIGLGKEKDPLPRSKEIEEILLKIKNNQNILIIYGASGSGKSTIVNDLLLPVLIEEGWEAKNVIRGFENIISFKDKIRGSLYNSGISKYLDHDFLNTLKFKKQSKEDIEAKIVLVFDQFEQFFENASEKDICWFRNIIDAFESIKKFTIIIIVREEYFSKLAFIKDKYDIFNLSIYIPGINLADKGDEDTIKAIHKLGIVVKNEELTKEICNELESKKEVLPLEIQIVGYMLEVIKHELSTKRDLVLNKDTFKKYYQSKEGLIREYFVMFIDAMRYKDTAKSVLYALSTEKRIKRRYTIEELSYITHREEYQINEVLESLFDLGIITIEDGRYAFAHDYFAEKYHELSGTLIEPIDRDNISYFSDIIKSRKKRFLKERESRDILKKRNSIINIVFLLIYSILVFRLLCPLFRIGWDQIESIFNIDAFTKLTTYKIPFDYYYLPAFIASSVCACYVWNIFRNFILLVPTKRFLSIVFFIINCLMILLGTIEPHYWIVFAGIAGFLIAVRILMATAGSQNKWLPRQYNFIRSIGYRTLINMIIFIGLGLLFNYYALRTREINQLSTLEGLFILEFVISFFVFAFMVMCIRNHATKYKGIIFLSTIKRFYSF